LEKSIGVLTCQYEACEGVRMDASDLETSPCSNEHGLLRFTWLVCIPKLIVISNLSHYFGTQSKVKYEHQCYHQGC